jgi:hypothetical protein
MFMVVDFSYRVLFTGPEADCKAFVKAGGHQVIHIAKDVIWVQ